MTHDISPVTSGAHGTVHAPKPMRVLMVHWDGGGNMPPQRALARELKRRGHDVHVLTHNSLADTVMADGGTFHALDTAPQYNPTQPHTYDGRLPAVDPGAADSRAPEPVPPVETKVRRIVEHRRRVESWRTQIGDDPEAKARARAFLHKMIRPITR